MEAKNAPIRRKAAKEAHTSDTPIGQPGSIKMPDEGLPERGEAVEAITEPLQSDYTKALLFAEEPVTIIINKGQEKHAPLTVDCWCNGKGAEVWADGRWVEFGWLPVEKMVTTKRKYVEILARSKHMSIQTESGKIDENSEKNEILRSNSLKAQFSVVGDKNPNGGMWLANLLREQA